REHADTPPPLGTGESGGAPIANAFDVTEAPPNPPLPRGGKPGLRSASRSFQIACRAFITLAVLGSSAWQLIRVHPFELSYYNELIGGARGARKAGFEMSYWYDVYTLKTVDVFNKRLPQGATIDFLSLSIPPVFTEYRALGHLRSDVGVGAKDP